MSENRLYAVRVDYHNEIDGPSSDYYLTVGKNKREVTRFYKKNLVGPKFTLAGARLGRVTELADLVDTEGQLFSFSLAKSPTENLRILTLKCCSQV
jgi:hypothetical protein